MGRQQPVTALGSSLGSGGNGMAWIAGLVLTIGFVWLMAANQRFRRIGFGLFAVIIVAIAVLWLMERHGHQKFMAEVAREKAAIPHSAVVSLDVV
jgi:hypothetical protein